MSHDGIHRFLDCKATDRRVRGHAEARARTERSNYATGRRLHLRTARPAFGPIGRHFAMCTDARAPAAVNPPVR